jgi:hypothetical protein
VPCHGKCEPHLRPAATTSLVITAAGRRGRFKRGEREREEIGTKNILRDFLFHSSRAGREKEREKQRLSRLIIQGKTKGSRPTGVSQLAQKKKKKTNADASSRPLCNTTNKQKESERL